MIVAAVPANLDYRACLLTNDLDRRDKHIAGAALGADDLGRALSGLDLPAQPRNLHVDRAVVHLVVVQPRQAEQLVFAVVDASGTYSKMAQEITLARIVQAGVVPMDTAAICSELQKTWNRDDAQQWAEAYAAVFPPYQLLIESFLKAQEVVKQNETLARQGAPADGLASAPLRQARG